MIIEYTRRSADTGITYRYRHYNVARYRDEPVPGDSLRVCYNNKGYQIGGPLVSELIDWKEI